MSFATCCVCLELRSLPSAGVTRFLRYYEPLRHPRAPSLYVTSYTEGFSHFVTSMTAPVASGWSDLAGWGLHPLESAALSRRTQIAVIYRGTKRQTVRLPGHTGFGWGGLMAGTGGAAVGPAVLFTAGARGLRRLRLPWRRFGAAGWHGGSCHVEGVHVR